MRISHAVSTSLIFILAACGQAAAPSNADAQPAAQAAPAAGALTAADRTAILGAMHLTADRGGQVENACSEKVAPQFTAIDLGGAVGTAQLVIIPGGPNSASCYGDGPGDMHLFRRDGAAFSDVHSLQGAFLAVLATNHGGVRDIADAGPGMSHPLYQWNGTTYAQHGQIADAAMSSAQIYPQ
jgi:hypothetical protein